MQCISLDTVVRFFNVVFVYGTHRHAMCWGVFTIFLNHYDKPNSNLIESNRNYNNEYVFCYHD